jgi:hypothetical protein
MWHNYKIFLTKLIIFNKLWAEEKICKLKLWQNSKTKIRKNIKNSISYTNQKLKL